MTNVFRYRAAFPCSEQELYDWHARPGALERLVPPWEKTKVLWRRGGLEPGGEVQMRMHAGPFPFVWLARHVENEPGKMFRDIQVKGPFSSWSHTHLFRSNDYGAELEDTIAYQLPLDGVLPAMVKRVIHRRLEQTFSHRERVLAADLELHKKYGHKCLKILVTGATGVLGRGLLPLLTTGGHDVYTLVRNRSQRGGKKLFWDPVTGFIEDLPQFDAVIHLAGEYIGVGRWNRAKKKEVIDSRVAGTNLLLEKLMSRPPKVFLCASAVGYYGDGKEKYLDESSPRGNDFISEVCHLWERSAARASSADVRTVFLRIGVSLSPTGGALQRLLSTAPLGLIRRFGDGKQYISWVSQEDTIGAVYHAMCCEDLSGPVNIVAPQPVSNETFMQELAKISGYPLLFPLPASLLKTLYGQMAEEILLSGCRVSCQKLIDSGYVFRHATLQEALAALLGKGGQNRVGSTGRGEKSE